MEQKIKAQDIDALTSILTSLSSLSNAPSVNVPIRTRRDVYKSALSQYKADKKASKSIKDNLTLRERFSFIKVAHNLRKALKGIKEQQSLSTIAHSIADALEIAVPLYKKAYGEDKFVASLGYSATTKSSIDLLRKLGANETAALCEKAQEARQAKQAQKHAELQDFKRLMKKSNLGPGSQPKPQ